MGPSRITSKEDPWVEDHRLSSRATSQRSKHWRMVKPTNQNYILKKSWNVKRHVTNMLYKPYKHFQKPTCRWIALFFLERFNNFTLWSWPKKVGWFICVDTLHLKTTTLAFVNWIIWPLIVTLLPQCMQSGWRLESSSLACARMASSSSSSCVTDVGIPLKHTSNCPLYYGHLKLFLPREKLGPTNYTCRIQKRPTEGCLLWLQPTQQCQLRGRLFKLVHLQGIKFGPLKLEMFGWFLLRKNRKLPTSPFFFVCLHVIPNASTLGFLSGSGVGGFSGGGGGGSGGFSTSSCKTFFVELCPFFGSHILALSVEWCTWYYRNCHRKAEHFGA